MAPAGESELHEPQAEIDEPMPRVATIQPTGLPTGSNVPRRSSGGLPRWLLAETGAEAEGATEPADVNSAEESIASPIEEAAEVREAERIRVENSLSEEDVAALSSSLVEAKQEETQAKAQVDAVLGDAEFDEEDGEEEEEEAAEQASQTTEEAETEEIRLAEEAGVPDESVEESAREPLTPQERADAEADAAHEDAEHETGRGERAEGDIHEHGDSVHEHETIEAASGEQAVQPAVIEDDVILLPGETRSPRSASAPRENFPPRDSARIGGNPRSRFQRPFRGGSGGRDRGRDNRGGDRGGRPSGPPRGGRPGGRFERRPSGPGGPRHDRDSNSRRFKVRMFTEMLAGAQNHNGRRCKLFPSARSKATQKQ